MHHTTAKKRSATSTHSSIGDDAMCAGCEWATDRYYTAARATTSYFTSGSHFNTLRLYILSVICDDTTTKIVFVPSMLCAYFVHTCGL